MKNNKKINLKFNDRLLLVKDTIINIAVKRNNKNADVTYEAKITCPVCSNAI